MALYVFRCKECGEAVECRMGYEDADAVLQCTCGGEMWRRPSMPHVFWPSNFRPGFEHSAQRKLLDPDFQARTKARVARMQEGEE